LTKVHNVIQFEQEAWLKSYIHFNTSCRTKAENSFEKDFFKLMVNTVFGKSCENLRKRKTVKLINSLAMAKKYAPKTNLESFKILRPNLAAFTLTNVRVELCKPIYTGFSVLEFSKIAMYDFHYGSVKLWFENAQLLFTDTDSLAYEVLDDDVYETMNNHITEFDTSDFSRDHFLYADFNRKRLGKMKDECNGTPIVHFIGLSPKMYSIEAGNMYKRTAKGVKKSVIKSQLHHSVYKQVFYSNKKLYLDMNFIRSKDHNLFSIDIRKSGLHCFDSKRYISEDGINTLSHGHYKLL